MMSRGAGRSLVAEDIDDVPAGPDGLATMFADYDRVGFHGGNSLVLQAILQRPTRSVADFIAELGRSRPRKQASSIISCKLVGVAAFEPTAPSSRTTASSE